jgi:hypothetical protein
VRSTYFEAFCQSAAEGQLEDKATYDTVRGYMRRFTSGYEREIGIFIPEQTKRSVTNVSTILSYNHCSLVVCCLQYFDINR